MLIGTQIHVKSTLANRFRMRYSGFMMKNIILLIAYFLSAGIRLFRPGGAKTVLVENLLLRHQLLILNRSRQRAPKPHPLDRILLGVWTLLMNPVRIARNAVILKPSSLLRFHHALVKRKYRLLFSSEKNGSRDRKVHPKRSSVPLSKQNEGTLGMAVRRLPC